MGALPALLSTLVVSAFITVLLVPRPAGADQISDLKAQATAISQKLIQDQLQIGAYEQQYSVASEKVAADSLDLAQISQQIDQDEQQIEKDVRAVRQQAVMSYMDAGAEMAKSEAALFAGSSEAAQVTKEYTTIAIGNIETTLDLLHNAQRTLAADQVTLQAQQTQDRADQTRQASYLAQASVTEQQLEVSQSQVSGRLAAAVTAQATTQAAAAAAAVATAQRAASRPSATVKATGSAAGSDPALNSFLQCVVQVESGGNYAAVSPGGQYMGAFQFSQQTWNTAAQAAGLPSLVGVPPNEASKADQDSVAVALYALDGQQPWLGDRCS